jgi:uracil-DNA glycosylase family 4
MKGFFTKEQVASKSRPDGKTYSCFSCGLVKDAINPKMPPAGNFKKRILNIGIAPNEMEDEKRKPWQGKTGRLLQRTYHKLGIDLWEDCLNVNAVCCPSVYKDSGYLKQPSMHEIACCRKNILKIIREEMPDLIVLFGLPAVQSVIGHRWRKDMDSLNKWRGWVIPDQEFKCLIAPTFHPQYVEESDSHVETIWKNDLARAVDTLAGKKWERAPKPQIEIITDLEPLNQIKSGLVAFDYETTGLKPHATGHQIVCAAVATSLNHAYAFMIPPKRKDQRPFLNLLANPLVGKMAHNMKFEEIWSQVRLRQPVANWEWDSMIAAHIIDNRSGITSLKFQTYVNFGIGDYSTDIEPFLRGIGDSGNSMNQVIDLSRSATGRAQLLEYCALDAIYEYRLAMKQIDLINYDFLPF